MRLNRPSRSLPLTQRSARNSASRKLITLLLLFNLIALPTPAFINELKAFTSFAVTVSLAYSRASSKAFLSLFQSEPPVRRPDTLFDRLAHVSRIQISPRKFVGYQDQYLNFSALATNLADQTIQGVRFDWESSDPDMVQIDDTGRASLLQPGLVRITCRAGSAFVTIPVLVRPGSRLRQSDIEWRADQQSLNETSTTTGSNPGTAERFLSSLLDKLAPTTQAQSSWPDDFAYDELWTDPANLVGSPRNRIVESTRMGAVLPEGSNFEFAVPLVGLGGRGLATNLTLYYNSRVWSRRNNSAAFDAIIGWPAPGFSLGFGRVVFQPTSAGGNPTGKYLLIGADGTRHYLGSGTWMSGGIFQTSDGSHIIFNGNAQNGGTLTYKDGTNVSITPVNNRLLPTQITDTNGNYIQVAYKPDCYTDQSGTHCGIFPPTSIEYISDTLGRRIEFQYDSTGKLTSITTPGFGGTAQNPLTQTVARFDYQSLSISYNFSGLTVERAPGNNNVLKHIYFPATNAGYLFTYSGYGMIYNMSSRRLMSVSGSTITDGTESASVAFNYPTSGSTQLTDVPSFTQRTENATNAPQSVYSYSNSINTLLQTKTYTITQPDNTTVNLTRSTNASAVANGRLTQSETKIGSSSLGKSVLTYANDAGGSPQVQSVTGYDDTGTATKADFDYDAYGNMTNKRDYGYQISGTWQVRRRTRWVYTTIGLNIVDRVTEVDLYDAQQNTSDADDVMIAKTTYAYDNYAAMGGMEDYGGPTYPPPGHHLPWGTSVTARGNVTGVSEWADLQAGTTITHLAKYDIFGNVVKAQVSCCQQKDLTNTDATYWSQPDSVMSGDPNGVHETTSTDYDFNTSLATSRTDAAGLVTDIGYDAALNPSNITMPTGATAQASMNYGTLTSTSTRTYDDNGVTKTITSTTQYDGWGRVIQSVGANSAQVNTSYDAMGRVVSRTNPFAAGGTPGPVTTTQYDTANKAVITTLPDGNTVRSDYAGNTITSTDPVNRKSKRESDGLGRLVKVTEQDATGALSQETNYTYNLIDKLILVNQGNQTRSFKYDALGRLLFEKIPEQSATINDGTGAYWSAKYTYTEFNAVSTKQDARGVVTTFNYDALHRVTSISYDTSNAASVAATPAVSFGYDTAGALSSVNIGGQYSESYSFDDFYRVQSVTRWILGQSFDNRKTYTTSYEYNEASQLTKMTYPTSQQVAVNHDGIGRTQSLTYNPGDTTGYLTGITYNTTGQVSGITLGNGVVESYGYDANRLQMTSQTATKSGTTLMNLTYSYQASAGQNGAGSTAGSSGQLMSITGSINSINESAAYTYDLPGRLVTSNQTSNSTSAQRRFAYDRWGNRTGVWDAVSGGNQIQSATLQQSGGAPTNRIASVTAGSMVNYTYDAAGNVTSDGVHSYVYDAENRLVNMDSGAAQYRYDHQNRRVCKIVGSAWTHYIWEGGQVISEHDATTAYTTNPTYQVNSARVDYVYSGSRMIYNRQRASGGGSWTSKYYLSDRLSERVVTDTSGNVVGRQAHLPFGEDFATSGTQEKHHFTNYERDAESGLDYAVNRSFTNNIGRFNQIDPLAGSITNPQSLNRFSYVGNDPINRTDPLGLGWKVTLECTTVTIGGATFPSNCQYIWTWDPGPGETFTVIPSTPNTPLPSPPSIIGGGQYVLKDAPIPSDLRNRLERLLHKNNNKCANFVKDLINQVAKDTGRPAYSDNALNLYDAISGPGGGGYTLSNGPLLVAGEPAGGTVDGTLGNLGNPNATKPTVIISPQQYGNPAFIESAQAPYTEIALHETIHLAAGQGLYFDRQLADAAFKLLNATGSLSEKEINKYNKINDVNSASRWWDAILQKYCN